MEMQYNVTIYLNSTKPQGKAEAIKARVEFSYNPDTYGNGFGMYIKAANEPFGGQGYDIRYDTDFDPEEALTYIVQFYAKRYNGKNGAWKLVGIRVHVAEFED